ncbi:MAG: glycosyltransferase [Candidatus Absconditabacteria bacterium]
MNRQQATKHRIAMAGGGTGGHVFPIKSLIDYLGDKPDFSKHVEALFWFGSKDSLEQTVFKRIQQDRKGTDFSFVSIFSGKYRRETYIKSNLKNFRDIFLFIFGIFQSLRYIRKYKIDTIFCKGGYVALPLVVAGRILRKKIVVHESDTRAGLVNRLASKMATKVFTGFDGVLKKSETIGQILSDDLIFDGDINKTPVLKDVFAEYDSSKSWVLVVGGSQGSQRLYQSLIKAIQTDKILQDDFVFFVVLGLLNKDLSKDFESFANVHVFDFVSQKEMGVLCAHCDIALTRAGTTSLAEQKLYDMKLLIVPIGWTHDQYQNAERYEKNHNDVLLDQRNEDFLNKLVSELKKHKNDKKISSENDKAERIHEGKDKVWEALLG